VSWFYFILFYFISFCFFLLFFLFILLDGKEWGMSRIKNKKKIKKTKGWILFFVCGIYNFGAD